MAYHPRKRIRLHTSPSSVSHHTHGDYTIGWICPLEVEQIAAVEMLDDIHPRLQQSATDSNAYTLGHIQHLNVVIAGLPTTSNCSTATVVAHMRSTYPNLKLFLLVGIGGGVPTRTDAGYIRLGDVIVSKPNSQNPGVIQYDRGKAETGQFRRTGALLPPPNILLNAAQSLAVTHARSKKCPLQEHLKRIDTSARGLRRYKYPGLEQDQLYEADYVHTNRNLTCRECGCDANKRIISPDENDDQERIKIHRGTIASGEMVIRNGELRDALAEENGVLCFETEAAGALNDFSCLVIRGISDYSDSHKNDLWHGYAAAAAAAYARELLRHIPIEEANHCRVAESDISKIYEQGEHIADEAVFARLPKAKNASFDSFHSMSRDEQVDATCLEGTRVDLLQEIRQWVVAPTGKPLFWLSGAPGTGKSTIARTVAREFACLKQLGASFFFKRNDGDRGSASRLFTTIAAQLAQLPLIKPYIRDSLIKNPGIAEKSIDEQFETLLLNPLSVCQTEIVSSPLLFVIDALDECDGDWHVRMIVKLFSRTQDVGNIRILLTSRPELPIDLGFKQLSPQAYRNLILQDIPIETTKHDISVYLENKFRQIRIDYYDPSSDWVQSDWPGSSKIGELTNMACPLFIFAATVCRFLVEGFSDPQEQLDYLIKNRSDSFDQINAVYRPILQRLLSTQGTQLENKIAKFKSIVGSIVVAAESLSISTWASLLGYETSIVTNLLKSLRSVLKIKDNFDPNFPIRLHHLSFANFLLDTKRRYEHEFWIDAEEIHGILAIKCLDLVINSSCLKQDICNLRDPGYLREKIEPGLVTESLSAEVQYACHYWTWHLTRSKSGSLGFELEKRIQIFLKSRFLFWTEALSLLGRVREAPTMISDVWEYVSNCTSAELQANLYDARRFLLSNSYIADIAPLQLYSSCTALAPKSSIVRTNATIPPWLNPVPEGSESWSSVLQVLEGHSDHVLAVAWSPDDKLLASGSYDCTIKIWDVASGKLQQTLSGSERPALSICFSPIDGRLLACGWVDMIGLWETASWGLLETLKLASWATSYLEKIHEVIFSRDGRYLLCCSNYGKVGIWEMASGKYQRTSVDAGALVKSATFSPDSKTIAMTSTGGIARIWDVLSGQLQHTIRIIITSGEVRQISFSSDNRLPAVCVAEYLSYFPICRVEFWNITSGTLENTVLGGFNFNFNFISLPPSGSKYAVATTADTAHIGSFPGAQTDTLSGFGRRVCRLAFSHHGKLLAGVQWNKTITLWEVNPEQTQRLQYVDEDKSGIHSIAFSPNGKLIATGYNEEEIKIWTVAHDQLRLQQASKHLSGTIYRLVFSRDSEILASASSNDTIKVWNVSPGLLDLRCTLRGHLRMTLDVRFSSDGKLLAVWSLNDILKIWDSNSGDLINRIDLNDWAIFSSLIKNPSMMKLDLGENQVRGDVDFPDPLEELEPMVKLSDRGWLLVNNREIFWLPPGCRKQLTFYRNLVAIGLSTGRVILLGISLDVVDRISYSISP